MKLACNAVITGAPAVVADKIAEYLKRFGEPGGYGRLDFCLADKLPHADAYKIELAPEGVTVRGASESGLFYGAQKVLMLMEMNGFENRTRVFVPVCDLRGVKIYLPEPSERGMNDFRRLVDLMARYHYNFLMIETGGAMEYKSHPEINEGWVEYSAFMNEYSGKPQEIQNAFAWRKNSIHTTNGAGQVVPQTMIREMIDYCRERFIEVVPEMPSLSHCDYLLTRHHELAERQDDPYPDTVCPEHPDYYPLLHDLLDEHIALFQPKRMHLGHDEYYSVAHCPRCKHLKAPEIYAADLKKCRDYLKERGVELMIWGEKLLNSHLPDGAGCGGADVYYDIDGEKVLMTPAIWPSIDMIDKDIQIMHWYWSIDREYDKVYQEKGFRMMFGNMRSAQVPEWEKRIRAANFMGTCCSNWGATDPVTLQRNGIFFEIAYTHYLHWGNPNDFAPWRDAAFDGVYSFCNALAGAGRYMEVLHRTDEARNYHTFCDGYFIDEAADLLGHHIFRSADGQELRFPVKYGTNISSAKAKFDRDDTSNQLTDPELALDCRRDTYGVDMQLFETVGQGRPEKVENTIAARTRYALPDDGREYSYAGFEAVEGFAGKVELLSSQVVYQK